MDNSNGYYQSYTSANHQGSYTSPQSNYGSHHGPDYSSNYGSSLAGNKEPAKRTPSYLNESNLKRIPEKESRLRSYVRDKQAFEQVALGKEGHRPDMKGMVWDMDRRINGQSTGDMTRR